MSSPAGTAAGLSECLRDVEVADDDALVSRDSSQPCLSRRVRDRDLVKRSELQAAVLVAEWRLPEPYRGDSPRVTA